MNRIQELRKAKNIKQLDLCALLNISQPTLSGWENVKFQGDYEVLRKMSAIFNVSIEYILGYTDNPNPPDINKPITQPLPYPPKILALAEKIETLPPELKDLIIQQIKVYEAINRK